ncbi:2-oxo acid dehydrogenase subunit E2 [Candidatus Woesearchaeota archaeon]|nr:2-oxo acid dehydrogenase subunit E2 [Candidatus Woesearchaeota archaeon]
MVTEFRFPDVGEGITEGELVKWLVEEGDTVELDQPIAELETDKAVVEIPSPIQGKILKRHAKEGETVKVGAVLVTIGEKGETLPSSTAKQGAKEQQRSEQQPRFLAAPTIGVGQQQQPSGTKIPPISSTSQIPQEMSVLATPAIRKAARELNIDLSTIQGSGPGGRIELHDLSEGALGKGDPTLTNGKAATPSLPKSVRETSVQFEQYGRVLRMPLKGARKIIAERMSESARKIPHVSHMDMADVSALWDIRNKEKSMAENRGFKLTFLPFVIKACVKALKNHPFLNSSLDETNEAAQEIVLKQYYNIGFAVDTGQSLLVPVLKKADEMSVMDIAQHIQKLSDAARDKSIQLSDMQGGSFSITNIGSIGGTFFTPIINYPEAAILGMGKIEDRAVVREGKIMVRKVLPLVLAFDHRILDGAKAALFMNDVKKHLEDPDLFLVDTV